MKKHLLYRYLELLYRHNPAGLILNLTLMNFLGLLEGISIFMIIPLLGLAGIIEAGTAVFSGLPVHFSALFDGFDGRSKIILVLFIYTNVIMLHSLLHRYQAVLSSRIEQSFNSALTIRLHRALTYARWSFHLDSKQSDISHILTTELSRVSGGTYYLLKLSTIAVTVLIHLIIAFLISVPLTLLVLTCGIVLFLILRPLLEQSRSVGELLSLHTQDLFAQISDQMGGMKEVKTNCAEEKHLERFSHTVKALENNMVKFTKLHTANDFYYKTGAAFTISIFFYFALITFQAGAAELLLLLFIFSRLWPRFSTLQSGLQQIFMMLPAFQRIMEFENNCLEAQENSKTGTTTLSLLNEIEFNGVFFRYLNNTENLTIENASFTIPACSTIAIAGSSGAGKSTLVDLLLGLLTPERGKILIDGIPLTEENIYTWRQKVGYVCQDPFLFNASIRNNLLWVRTEANEEELWEALSSAAAEQFVRNLPAGLDTIIGERGIKLSGGERQRIVLARTLLKKPSILILDEATNALDMQNESAIFQAIEALHNKLTIIILTHRLSTITSADKIIVVEGGRIVETGNYTTLSNAGSRFKALLLKEAVS